MEGTRADDGERGSAGIRKGRRDLFRGLWVAPGLSDHPPHPSNALVRTDHLILWSSEASHREGVKGIYVFAFLCRYEGRQRPDGYVTPTDIQVRTVGILVCLCGHAYYQWPVEGAGSCKWTTSSSLTVLSWARYGAPQYWNVHRQVTVTKLHRSQAPDTEPGSRHCEPGSRH